MQVRRARTERLVLVPASGGVPVELATARRVAGSVDSQDEVAVSPDGTYLAWTTTDDDRLHLRDADGHERTLARYGRKMRFSPDGNWLAAIVDVGRGDWHQLVVWELATGRTRSLVDASAFGRFGWARGGIVIAQGDKLVYAPLAGERRVVFEPASGEQLQRFTASAATSRVVIVVDTKRGLRVRALDVEQPEHVRDLGALPGTSVDNAEQSGDRVVLATTTGLYAVDGETAPRELSARRDIHSLWFAPDGRLGYASPAGTTILDGKRAHRLETREPIGMMRFDHSSARVLVASGRDVRSWDPASDQQTVLASAQEGEQLLGADRYRGGVVLWTGHDGATPSHRILRVLRVNRDGTAAELNRLDGDRAANTLSLVHDSFFGTSGDAVVYRDFDGYRWHVRAGSTERAVSAMATLSPTGHHVLVSRTDTVANIDVLSLVDIATGAERRLFVAETIRDVAFSADGTHVAIVRTDQGHETVAMIEVATGTARTFPGDHLAWTARGLLVWGAKDMTLVSPSGQVERILDEPVEAGLSHVAASGSRALVCFRGGSAQSKTHPGVLSIDLQAPAHPLELDISNCWTRSFSLSPDGQQVVFSANAAYGVATDDLEVTSATSVAPPRKLGDGYNEVIFDRGKRLAFVSHRGIEVVDGARTDRFDTDGRVEGLHFTADGSLSFAIDRDVVAWDPRKNTKTVLARAPEGQRILAMAPTNDGFVLATVE